MQCIKVIAKAKALAVKYEKHLELLKLLQWEIELFKAVSYIGKTEMEVEGIFQEMFAVEKNISNLNQYSRLTSQLSITRKKKGQPRNKEDWKTYEDILKHPLFAETQVGTQNFVSLSVLAQCYFYTCKSNYYELKMDYSASEQYALKQIKLFEENFHLTADNPISYINALWNLIISQLDLRKYGEAHLTIDKLNRFSVGCSKNIRQIVFYWTANAELVLYTETGNIKQGIARANEMIIEYGKMNIEPKDKFRELLLYKNIAQIYFYAGNYALANTYLNKILNDTTYPNNDGYCFARIMSLLVHFEIGNQHLLEYTVKSVHQFLYKRNRLYKAETLILDFIRKDLPKIHSDKELLKSFEVLLIEMKAIANDPFEQRAFDYFDFISWLESKIEGKPFAEVVRGKAIGKYFEGILFC